MTNKRFAASAIKLLFLVSGATGLGYQVLWSKYILDFIGVSAYSYATVLAAFMAGLALGSKYLGRWADRFQSPLKLYAFLELGIGLYATLYLPLTTVAASLYGTVVEFTPEAAGAGYGVWAKILISVVILIPPTMLMGGTFPAILRHVTENLGSVGLRSSQFYAINAFGAAGGGLFMAFIMMPALGMRTSLMTLALVNGFVGLASYMLAREPQQAAVEQRTATPAGTTPRAKPVPLTAWQIQLGFMFIFTTGVFGFFYEIGWTRFFSVMVGSSTYSFSVVLAAFISGIAVGSAWLVRLDEKIKNPMGFFGWAQIVAAFLVVLPFSLYPYIPWLFQSFSSLLSDKTGAFYFYEFGKMALCFVVMFPPTVFLGMSIPLVIRGMSQSLEQLGQESGRVYAWNTWGNVIGAFLAGLMLLPLLGIERLISWTAIGNALVGVLIIATYSERISDARLAGLWRPVAALGSLMLVLLVNGSWDNRLFSIQAFRRHLAGMTWADVVQYRRDREVAYMKDDPATSLLVIKGKQGTPVADSVALFVNGKPDASNTNDLPTQLLSGHIPVLLHPEPRDVLVVGLASGVTVGATLKHDIDRVDVVELVRAMPEAAKFFNNLSGDPLSDPRTHMIYDDARSYISYTSQDYDVIISEPSNPWIAGVGALFTTEHFSRVTKALKPNGIYLQWIQGYSIGNATLASVVRSMRKSFPYIYGFQGCNYDLFLIGALEPIQLDYDRLKERIHRPKVKESLARIRIRDVQTLLSFQSFSPSSMDYLASLTYVENTDDNHFLEYRAPRDLFQMLEPEQITRYDERLVSAPTLAWSEWLLREDTSAQIQPTLAAMSQASVAVPDLEWAYQMAYFHAAELDSIEGPMKVNSYLPADFWETEPLTLSQTTERVDRFLEMEQTRLALAVIERFYSVILLEAAMSERFADFWIQATERWYRTAPEQAKQVPRNLLIDLLETTGNKERSSEMLRQAVEGQFPPAADWAVLRACRTDESGCRRIVNHYLANRPPLWLSYFARLRFPDP